MPFKETVEIMIYSAIKKLRGYLKIVLILK
jgi:hypothetical protein